MSKLNADNGFQQTAGQSRNNEPKVGGVECNELEGILKVDLAAVDTAGGVLSVANPLGASLQVTRVIINTTTETDGACTLDTGIAAGATTLSDTLLDANDLSTSAKNFDSADETDSGTNGKASRLWGASEFVTSSVASGRSLT